MTRTTTAKNCFAENIRLFASAQTEPEKYNLYNGLAALAAAVASIEEQLASIDRRLKRIEASPR